LASIVDFFILDLTLFPVIGIVFVMFFGWDSVYAPMMTIPVLLGFWLYFSIMEWKWGASVGKRLFRIRVMGMDGTNVSLPQSVVRFPVKLVSLFTVIGILMIDATPGRQALHDMVCRTLVTRV
jgi:uncharacterized RDD family membrane protein YckC